MATKSKPGTGNSPSGLASIGVITDAAGVAASGPLTGPITGPITGPSDLDRAEMDVEYEHALWACEAGLRPLDVVRSIGSAWPSWREPSWHDAVATLRWARRTILARPAIAKGKAR